MMIWRRNLRRTPAERLQPAATRILMVTVETLPEPYEILGLVEATMAVSDGTVSTSRLLDLLENEAVAMGADGVIGIRLSQFTLPGASRARLIGRVIDHFGNTAVATALGTAIRRSRTADLAAGPSHRCGSD